MRGSALSLAWQEETDLGPSLYELFKDGGQPWTCQTAQAMLWATRNGAHHSEPALSDFPAPAVPLKPLLPYDSHFPIPLLVPCALSDSWHALRLV